MGTGPAQRTPIRCVPALTGGSNAIALDYFAAGDARNENEKALNGSRPNRELGIKEEPAYDLLGSDPRFQDLVRRINLQP